jgi:hypothetical protein
MSSLYSKNIEIHKFDNKREDKAQESLVLHKIVY